MKPLKVGLLQATFRSAFRETIPDIARESRPQEQMGEEDFRHNHELLIAMAREAAGKGADLVLGPESYLDGWSARADILQRVARPIPGPEIEQLCDVAAELKIWMCVGLFERADGAIYNSAVLISSEGRIEGVYRKTHETAGVLADMPYELGDALPVFETPWGTLGILVCHDRWYPEAVRTLRCSGAELVLNPTATAAFSPYHAYHDIHRCTLRAQAYQNAMFWVSCNAGNHGGHSVIVAPDGTVIAEASGGQEVAVVDLDPGSYSGYDFVSNLRGDLYTFGRG